MMTPRLGPAAAPPPARTADGAVPSDGPAPDVAGRAGLPASGGGSTVSSRERYATPSDVNFLAGGCRCPMCPATTLRATRDGWSCPSCVALWWFDGTHGRWLPKHAAPRPRGVGIEPARTPW